jgi:uncharacterized protein YgbK (DUF1537 family)
MSEHHPTVVLDPIALATEGQSVGDVLTEARPALEAGAVLIHSTATPDELRKVQETLGQEQASEVLEEAFGTLATELVEAGARSLVVAGGETAGSVARALGLRQLRIGPEIDPGVPWTLHLGEPAVHLAFKSGNFGSDVFFLKALNALDRS